MAIDVVIACCSAVAHAAGQGCRQIGAADAARIEAVAARATGAVKQGTPANNVWIRPQRILQSLRLGRSERVTKEPERDHGQRPSSAPHIRSSAASVAPANPGDDTIVVHTGQDARVVMWS